MYKCISCKQYYQMDDMILNRILSYILCISCDNKCLILWKRGNIKKILDHVANIIEDIPKTESVKIIRHVNNLYDIDFIKISPFASHDDIELLKTIKLQNMTELKKIWESIDKKLL